MIFVTVGNHPQPFNRLLRKVDRLAAEKVVQDVFIQTGYSDYQPNCCEYSSFVGFSQFSDLIRESDIVITHGGEGSIGNALLNKKIPVVVPRLRRYSEHTNDHQLQITRVLEKQGRIVAVYDIDLLEQALNRSKTFVPHNGDNQSQIIALIEEFLDKV